MFIEKFLIAIFGTNVKLATIIISMLPVIELKGAIPIAMSVELWGANALSNKSAFFLALLGSSLVVPILALVFQPIINWLKTTKFFHKIARVLEDKVVKHSSILDGKSTKKKNVNKTLLKALFLFLFVSMPLPLTGVWTGTCVGVMMGLNYWQVVLSVILGNIVAGLIIVFVCSLFPAFTIVLVWIVLIIVLLMITYLIVKTILYKPIDNT